MADAITIGQMMREAMEDVRPGILVYRCRACGCTVRVRSEQAARDAAGLAMLGQAITNQVHSEMYQLGKVTMPHRCGADQVGVCDLIGAVAEGGELVVMQVGAWKK